MSEPSNSLVNSSESSPKALKRVASSGSREAIARSVSKSRCGMRLGGEVAANDPRFRIPGGEPNDESCADCPAHGIAAARTHLDDEDLLHGESPSGSC